MLKKFKLKYSDLYIGTAREVKNLYKNFCEKTEYLPVFGQRPKFSHEKIYGLNVRFFEFDDFEEPLHFPCFSVVNRDTALELLSKDGWVIP